MKLLGSTVVNDPPWATNAVECRGEPLDAVLWLGAQWAVTIYGVERRDGRYVIEKNRVFEMEKAGYSWERHMAGKSWIDMPDFECAMRIAREVHPQPERP